jgi:sugar phosphate isomerase/epimerase
MATTDPASEPPLEALSDPMRRIVEALVEGIPVPPDAEAALTPDERAEVGALVRTANLTYLTLQQPDPPTEAEARSLARAQDALSQRPPVPVTEEIRPRPALLAWLERLRNRRNE